MSRVSHRMNASLAPSGDHSGLASPQSALDSSSRSCPSLTDRSHSSLRPALKVRYATFEPSARASKSTSPVLPLLIGFGSPVTRPLAGSNGNDHSLVRLDVAVKSSLVPSGDSATFVSSPAPVVRRSGPSTQASVTGSMVIRQTFCVSPARPSK